MIGSLHPFRALAGAAGGLRDDLAPATDTAERLEDALRDQLDRLVSTWPLALVALTCAGALIAGVATVFGSPDMLLGAGLDAAFGAGLAAVLMTVLKLPACTHWQPHVRVRVAGFCAAGISVALLSLLAMTAQLPTGSYRLASFVAVFA